jgi:hypothetical protein
MPPLRGEKARKDSLQFFFFERDGVVLFLRPYGWLFEIYLRLIPTGGLPGFYELKNLKVRI